MEIRVQGPVEVVVEARFRPLPGGGEREPLALLALSAGRVVAVPALANGPWSEDLPANPGIALRVRVSKLRPALASAGAPSALVLTRPPGFLLDVDPMSEIPGQRPGPDQQSGVCDRGQDVRGVH